jgi:hypothetical protein
MRATVTRPRSPATSSQMIRRLRSLREPLASPARNIPQAKLGPDLHGRQSWRGVDNGTKNAALPYRQRHSSRIRELR